MKSIKSIFSVNKLNQTNTFFIIFVWANIRVVCVCMCASVSTNETCKQTHKKPALLTIRNNKSFNKNSLSHVCFV